MEFSSGEKPIVFISHIAEEREIAIAFKELVESSFSGMIDVFVSFVEESIPMGQKWLEDITGALKTCAITVIICSPKSVDKPWINFEAGAGWIRDIPIIPLCHSGMEPSKLPLPLNLLQAGTATELSSLKSIFSVFASQKEPKADFSEFISRVREFEKVYTFWDNINKVFEKISHINTQIIEDLKSHKSIQIQLTEPEITLFESVFKILEQENILRFRGRVGGAKMNRTGMYISCIIEILPDFKEVVSDKHFIFYKDFSE